VGGNILIDGHAGAILKAYREHLMSKDKIFLSRNWERIRKATEYIISEDENEDGLIEKRQANTYDIAFFGANTYVGGLYLAALKAASEMALIINDTTFSAKCIKIFEDGRKNTVKRLWNGEYFIQDVDLKEHPKFQYADGCLSDQLFGQTWAHLINLGYIYPEEITRETLKSIWKYNWAPDVGVQNANHPPERVYADPGEAGLLICTWPRSTHLGEDGVRYRDEVWTGIEYQVATSMVYQGMIEEAMSILRAVHDRYSPEKHNPWNEIECGDHYARAMASWGIIIALEDFFYNGPMKYMRFNPRIQQDSFKSFFTASEGWGNIEQTRKDHNQINTISLAYGKLQLSSFEVGLIKKPVKVQLFIDNEEIPCTYALNGKALRVNFEEKNIHESQSLKLLIQLSEYGL